MYQARIGLFFINGKRDFHYILKLQCHERFKKQIKKLIFTTTIPFFFLSPKKYVLTKIFNNKILSDYINLLTHKNIHFEIEVIKFIAKLEDSFIK